MKIETRRLVSTFLLNLPLGWICLAGGRLQILLSLCTFYAVKAPVAWILYLRPKLKLPTCVLGICLTCGGTLWYAEWSSNDITDLLRWGLVRQIGAKSTFYPEISNNLMFEKCEFCEK